MYLARQLYFFTCDKHWAVQAKKEISTSVQSEASLGGVLPHQSIVQMIKQEEVGAANPIEASQIQPASLDLRVGAEAYRVRASFCRGRTRLFPPLGHGQIVGRLVYEQLSERPNEMYGEALKSNYQKQKPKLGKHFKDWGRRLVWFDSLNFDLCSRGGTYRH